MNKIILSGNICKDIEVKYYNDKKCLKNTIAVRRDFKNKDGEYESDFYNFTIWGVQAEYIEKYATKGDKILLSGSLRNNNYQNSEGATIYSTDIQVENVEIISRKNTQTQETTNNNEQAVEQVKDLFGDAVEIQEQMPF